MPSIFRLFLVLALAANCAPRDDERNAGNGGGNRGGTVAPQSIDKEGAKLNSCSKADDPTWNTIRLFAELSFMFNKVNDLKVVVGKGSRNCVKVSSSDPVEIVLQDAPKSKNFDSSGAFYYVTKLEIMNTSDLVSNAGLLEKTASDMGMSADQLKNFLNAEPKRDQITLTFLKSTDGVAPKPKQDEFELEEGVVLQVVKPGKKLPSCSKADQPTWRTIRIPFGLSKMTEKLEEVSAVLGKGSFNCVPVADENTIELELQEEEGGKKFKKLGAFYEVDTLVMMNSSDLLADEELIEETAKAMTLEKKELLDYINAEPVREIVTITYLTLTEEKKKEPVSSPVVVAKLPEYDGKSISDCGTNFWTSVRVGEGLKEKMLPSVLDKSLKAIVGPGDRNCLKIGGEAVISFRTATGWEDDTNKFKVVSVTIRDKANFLNDPILFEHVADQMALNAVDFTSVLESFANPKVNVTRVEWIEAQ